MKPKGLPLAINTGCRDYLDQRGIQLHEALAAVNGLAERGELPDASLADGVLKITPLTNTVPPEADVLARQVFAMLPRIKITDSRHFVHLCNCDAATDRTILLTAILADAINLGLNRMADACPGTSLLRLSWIADWHVRDETYSTGLAEIVNYHRQQPFAGHWGEGTTSSSDGQQCPRCGADVGDHPPGQIVCPACAKPYSVAAGTMFEGSSLPVRHWFFLIHQMYLTEPGLPDDEIKRRMGIDLAVLLALCRIAEAVTQGGLPAGDELKRAIAVRNKELIQDDVVRAIIEYGKMEAVRDRLMQARVEGTHVDDLPDCMTLNVALEKIEARIAEEDRYLISKEDGYLVKRLAEPAVAADAGPESGETIAAGGSSPISSEGIRPG